jgi:hypothetical protein
MSANRPSGRLLHLTDRQFPAIRTDLARTTTTRRPRTCRRADCARVNESYEAPKSFGEFGGFGPSSNAVFHAESSQCQAECAVCCDLRGSGRRSSESPRLTGNAAKRKRELLALECFGICAPAYPVTITSDMKSSTYRIRTDLIQDVLRGARSSYPEANVPIEPSSYASDYRRA